MLSLQILNQVQNVRELIKLCAPGTRKVKVTWLDQDKLSSREMKQIFPRAEASDGDDQEEGGEDDDTNTTKKKEKKKKCVVQ